MHQLEARQRAELAARFRAEEAKRQEERRLEKEAKKAKEEAERQKREKEEAWRKQTAEARAKQEEELHQQFAKQKEEERKRTEALLQKKLAAASELAEKKEKFELKKKLALEKIEEQTKAREEEFEKSKQAAEEHARRRAAKEADERERLAAKGLEKVHKRDKCQQESEAKLEARRKKLLSEQEALEAQVVAFAQKSEKELTHKVMAKQLKALEKVELVNVRERSLAFKRETVKAELEEKMARAEVLKEHRARLAEERRMANIRHAQHANMVREQITSTTIKMQRELFVDTHKRVKELADTLASQGSTSSAQNV